MPYRWVDPAIFLEWKGITIYHDYRDDMEEYPLISWYTASLEKGSEFDIRDLAIKLGMPIPHDDRDYHKEILKRAIEENLIH